MKAFKKLLAVAMSLVMLMSFMGVMPAGAATAECNHNIGTEDSTMVEYARVEATCSATGKIYYDCVKCLYTTTVELAIDPDNHTMGPWQVVTHSGCAVDGEKIRYCTNEECGFSETGVISANGEHTYPAAEVLDLWWMGADEVGDEYEGWTIVHLPTCTTTGIAKTVCTVCGGAEITAPLAMHSSSFKVMDQTESTCQRKGSCTVACEICNANFTYALPVNDNHSWQMVVDTEPDCTNEGLGHYICKWHTDVTKTDENGDIVYETISATGHSFTSYKSNNDANCSADGTKTAKCDNCDATQTVTDEGTRTECVTYWKIISGSCTQGGIAQQDCRFASCTKEYTLTKTFAPGEHVNLRTVTVRATCEQDGYKYEECPDCGFSGVLEGSRVSATGHSYEWTTNVAPNCATGSAGSSIGICGSCGAITTKEIPYEHSLVIISDQVEPSCVVKGQTAHKKCLYCTYEEKPQAIAATGHTDKDNNGQCDKCYIYYVENSDGSVVNCSCLCHNTDGLAKFLFRIFSFFCQVFGINQECDCGKLHYETSGIFG